MILHYSIPGTFAVLSFDRAICRDTSYTNYP